MPPKNDNPRSYRSRPKPLPKPLPGPLPGPFTHRQHITSNADYYPLHAIRRQIEPIRSPVKINSALGQRCARAVARQSNTVEHSSLLVQIVQRRRLWYCQATLLAPCWRGASLPSLLHCLVRPGSLVTGGGVGTGSTMRAVDHAHRGRGQ
jgi:hypothetical protein